jgi:LuxR family maltose regulon positive regulatory protein
MDRDTFSAALWATAAVAAAQNAREDISDDIRRTLSIAASTSILHMILGAGQEAPQAGVLLADFLELAQRRDTTQGIMAYASTLTDRWDEIQRRRLNPTSDVLSPREIAIVELISVGRSNKEIARRLGVMPETVKSHVKNIFAKLGVDRRAQAALRAHALGLIGTDASVTAVQPGR